MIILDSGLLWATLYINDLIVLLNDFALKLNYLQRMSSRTSEL